MKSRALNTVVLIGALIAMPGIVPPAFAAPAAGPKTKTEPKAVPVEAGPVVAIHVKGLACPFCVRGVEKKLKKLDGVQGIRIDLKSGMARVTYRKGAKPDLAALRKAIRKAGFTPGEVKPAKRAPGNGKKGKR